MSIIVSGCLPANWHAYLCYRITCWMADQTERDGQDGMEISRIHQLISHKYLSSENPLCLAGVSGGKGGGGGVYKTWRRWWWWWCGLGAGCYCDWLSLSLPPPHGHRFRSLAPFHHWRIDFALANIYIYWVGLKKWHMVLVCSGGGGGGGGGTRI